MASARESAVRCLVKVFHKNGFSTLVLQEELSCGNFTDQDKSFVSALFYGVLESKVRLDWILGKYLKKPVEKLDPEIQEILHVAVYQLTEMPHIPEHAVVDEAVKNTRAFHLSSASGFVNGVLRSFLRDGKIVSLPKDSLKQLSLQSGIPIPLLSFWRDSYGQDRLAELAVGLSSPAPLFVRLNSLKGTDTALMRQMELDNLDSISTELPHCAVLNKTGDFSKSSPFQAGLFHVQDLSSQKDALALDAKPGMRVLDVCSAPGGKTFTIAEEMENTGSIVAMDLYESRLNLVREGASRLGITIVDTLQNDATLFNPTLGKFDRVLCDVVCSGFGVIRRKPEIRYKDISEILSLPTIQLSILDTSSRYLATGGVLVYSTCTLNPAENENLVASFLQNHSDFSCIGQSTIFPVENGGDGFYMARLTH